jgi:GDP-D-mannose dehydratase
MANRIALMSGITGEDGAHLAEFLLGKGYIVTLHDGELTANTQRRMLRAM